MPTVNIVIDVDGQSAGSPGVAREFVYSVIGTASPLATLSLSDTAGITTYSWEIVDQPPGATAVLSDPTAAEPTFSPDIGVTGTYRFLCTVNDGQAWGKNALAFSTENHDLRKPAVGETIEFGINTGWAPAIQKLTDVVDAATVSSVPSTDVVPQEWAHTANANIPDAHGYIHTNSGATGMVILTLTAAAIGAKTVFTQTHALNQIVVAPGPTEVIYLQDGSPISVAVGGIVSKSQNATLSLVGISATEWVVVGGIGDWGVFDLAGELSQIAFNPSRYNNSLSPISTGSIAALTGESKGSIVLSPVISNAHLMLFKGVRTAGASDKVAFKLWDRDPALVSPVRLYESVVWNIDTGNYLDVDPVFLPDLTNGAVWWQVLNTGNTAVTVDLTLIAEGF